MSIQKQSHSMELIVVGVQVQMVANHQCTDLAIAPAVAHKFGELLLEVPVVQVLRERLVSFIFVV